MKRKGRKSTGKHDAGGGARDGRASRGPTGGDARSEPGPSARPDADAIVGELQSYGDSFKRHTGLELDKKLGGALATYVSELFKWNERAALISHNDEPRVVERHIMDSLSLLAFVHETDGVTLLDIGSGAGFPAIPLKLAARGLSVAMVEAVRKKQLFLSYIIDRLSLADAVVLPDRAEHAPWRHARPEGFDVVTSRATLSLGDLARTAGPAIRQGGLLVAYKGGRHEEEIRQAETEISAAGLRLMAVWNSPWGPGQLVAFQRAG